MKGDDMLTFRCEHAPINDLDRDPDGHLTGWFSGEVHVEADMRRVSFISGSAEFLDDESAERIRLCELFVDLSADKKSVCCLFNDPNQ